MKNLMVVDGCQDYGFDIHRVSDEDLVSLLGRARGVAFIEDIYAREDYGSLFDAFRRMWYGRIESKDARGVDGILFYESIDRKRAYEDGVIDCGTGPRVDAAPPRPVGKHVIVFDADPSRKICAYAVDEPTFRVLFPSPQNDVAFAEDHESGRSGPSRGLMARVQADPLRMRDVRSIDGIVYVGYPNWRGRYPRRNDAEMARHYPLSR